MVVDAALHRHLCTPDELRAGLERMARWKGAPAARRAVAFADPRSESPGESRSRVAIARLGFPEPVLQWPVRRADGVVLGEVDFGWPELGRVGEFDGFVKYGRLLRPGQVPADVLFAEKVREDAIRSKGAPHGSVDLAGDRRLPRGGPAMRLGMTTPAPWWPHRRPDARAVPTPLVPWPTARGATCSRRAG